MRRFDDDDSPQPMEAGARLSDRRRFIATAAGLLVPAAAGLASIGDAEAGRGRDRRRRRRNGNQPPPVGGMFADDVLVKLINQTPERWDVWTKTYATRNLRPGPWSSVDPGMESAWNSGVSDHLFGIWTDIHIEFRALPGTAYTYIHSIGFRATNPEVGTPYATFNDQHKTVFSERKFGENERVEGVHHGIHYTVHRWSDGDETFNGHTEEYCRWVVVVRYA
ncbi:MAG: hypothetical protein ACKOWF_06340 [Chloroflexota bacterium]